jgi:hypothetical protein
MGNGRHNVIDGFLAILAHMRFDRAMTIPVRLEPL